MGTMNALRSMSRAAHSAVEANLPKPTTTPTETAKPAVTKTAAPKKSAGNAIGTPRWPADAVITVKKTDHGKKGNGAEALDIMKSGMTIEKYKAALEKKGRQGMFAWAVKYATDNGLATVK